MSDPTKEVRIDYTNHRGERSWRRILPLSLSFENSQWHPETQWILEAVDCDKNAIRDFALASIHEWRTSSSEPLRNRNSCESPETPT
jgi:predicted DNA-binding transcriptional regulator YafY